MERPDLAARSPWRKIKLIWTRGWNWSEKRLDNGVLCQCKNSNRYGKYNVWTLNGSRNINITAVCKKFCWNIGWDNLATTLQLPAFAPGRGSWLQLLTRGQKETVDARMLTFTFSTAMGVTVLAKWPTVSTIVLWSTTCEVRDGALDGRLYCGSEVQVWKLYKSRFMQDQSAKPDEAASSLNAMS